MSTKPKTKLPMKDTKTTCGCGQTVIWKYFENNSYVRTNECGLERHHCPPKLK